MTNPRRQSSCQDFSEETGTSEHAAILEEEEEPPDEPLDEELLEDGLSAAPFQHDEAEALQEAIAASERVLCQPPRHILDAVVPPSGESRLLARDLCVGRLRHTCNMVSLLAALSASC